MSASAEGRSPNASPQATGTIADTTAVIGATIPMPADRQPAVEEGDRHHPDDAGDDPDDDVFARSGAEFVVEADDRDDEHCGERVRQEDDPEHGHTALPRGRRRSRRCRR